MGSFDDFIRDLRRYEDKKILLKELRTEIRKPVSAIRKLIKATALAILPKSGGLNQWVAAIRITARMKFSGRSAGVSLVGGRRSESKAKSDIRAMNRGRLRAPSWGRKGRGDWHTQAVEPEFFTVPADNDKLWREAILAAVDKGLKVIRGG